MEGQDSVEERRRGERGNREEKKASNAPVSLTSCQYSTGSNA